MPSSWHSWPGWSRRTPGERAEYETVTTLFTEEKNGLRFPGKVVLDHSSYHWDKGRASDVPPRKRTQILVEQTYRKYQFFSVRTTEEIR